MSLVKQSGGGDGIKEIAGSRLNGHLSCCVLILSWRCASFRSADITEGTGAAGATSLSMGRPL